ncbi:unnamed protein product [Pipistrellus nathusii]|uniref:Uncharacterized protein n=1 Tax=Pipistrellus nathusii TaxID=59473 RepID=A0ABP0AE30_PIPNA
MEEASSGAEPPGKDFLLSPAPPQLGKARFGRPRGGRGLRLGSGSGSGRASRAQRGDRPAVGAFGNLHSLGRSLSFPSTRGANRKRAAGLSDGRAPGPMSTADGERGGEWTRRRGAGLPGGLSPSSPLLGWRLHLLCFPHSQSK